MAAAFQSDLRSALRVANTSLSPSRKFNAPRIATFRRPRLAVGALSGGGSGVREAVIEDVTIKPAVCTADELHYVTVPNSEWRLALWRYHPDPQAPPRNHPLLLLSGVGTNAIGYDLSPESSFARYMSGQGFDTWILEVRGAGLSMQAEDRIEAEQTAHAIVQQIEASFETAAEGSAYSDKMVDIEPIAVSTSEAMAAKDDKPTDEKIGDEPELDKQLTETFMILSERPSGSLSEGQSRVMSVKLFDQISRLLGDSHLIERFEEIRERLLRLLEESPSSAIAGQIKDLSQRLVNVIEEGQRSVSPQIFNLQERFSATLRDFQKQLDLIVKYDWDFDNMLEDVPAVMEYIRAQCKPKDNKLFAIGHSMGGILLYALLSRCGYEGRDPMLAAVATLAASVDYTTSKSSLKMLLPLADPLQALQVPIVPFGAILTAAYPFSSRPPYLLSWLNDMISAEDMMHPELLEKLILTNFCTIPAKLIIQLTTAFKEGGLCNREATFFFKDHLHKTKVPVLAIAGDRDLICPPEAVYDTVKLFPEKLVSYKVFGEPGGPHYAHYDLVGGRLKWMMSGNLETGTTLGMAFKALEQVYPCKAVEQVYPCIVQFLSSYE